MEKFQTVLRSMVPESSDNGEDSQDKEEPLQQAVESKFVFLCTNRSHVTKQNHQVMFIDPFMLIARNNFIFFVFGKSVCDVTMSFMLMYHQFIV